MNALEQLTAALTSGELTQSQVLEALHRAGVNTVPDAAALTAAARDEYQNEDVEIDDFPLFSDAKESGGTWVSAWVWMGAGDAA